MNFTLMLSGSDVWCIFIANVFTVVPKGKVREVTAMLKAIQAQEDREAAIVKAHTVADKLDEMRLKKAAQTVRNGAGETFNYDQFPSEHWRHLRTNNMLERIMREIRFNTLSKRKNSEQYRTDRRSMPVRLSSD